MDLRFPYHGKCTPPSFDEVGSHASYHCLYADVKQLVFGNGDLVIQEDLRTGSSELEGSYGVGLTRGSLGSQALLAGGPDFHIDALELYGVM